ncbi:MAG: citrate lyase subunit alpha [Sphaerochaetaceae bacterium]|nr:citrate lyase subunit alpha [Sphaerochaetaceae bacterium]
MEQHGTRRKQPAGIHRTWDSLFSSLTLYSGMHISFHHHLRYGDQVVAQVLSELGKRGLSSLSLCVSSIMGPAVESVSEAVRTGLVTSLETTGAKQPLSDLIADGALETPVIFRTHGGRSRALKQGETRIDLAFIAASAVDLTGACNGVDGTNPFGSMGYALDDALYADVTVIVSDFLSEQPLRYVSIAPGQVDHVVCVDSIGDSSLMSEGSLRGRASPLQDLIAVRTAGMLSSLGVIANGFSYQAGSGVISMQVTHRIAALMRERGITGSFASGGITSALVELLEQGLFTELYDVQSFDARAAESLKTNSSHHEMSAGEYADPTRSDRIASKLDVMILSATEVDVNFNLNSVTGTDGRIIGALGGAPDTAEGAKLTVAVVPSMRGRIPTIHQRVRTICTPGEFVDIIVCERGIAVNPLRPEVQEHLENSPVRPYLTDMRTLLDITHSLCGTPQYPERNGRVVAVIEKNTGGVLDTLCAL